MQVLVRWLNWGITEDLHGSARRKILTCNLFSLIGLISVLLYDSAFVLSGTRSAWHVAIAHLIFIAAFILVPWLNRERHFLAASWLVALAATGATLVPMWLAFGTQFNHHLYFILCAVLPVAIFADKRRPHAAMLFVVNSALYLYFELHGMAAAADIRAVDADWTTLLRGALTYTVLLTLGICYWAYDIFTGLREQELENLSMTDILTGLPNRRSFETALRQECARNRRNGSALSLAVLDIDHFKSINDTHGHDAGDHVIQCVAARLIGNLRASNIVARVGGDEFVVLMPATSLAEGLEGLERVRKAAETLNIQFRSEKMGVTLSIGIAEITQDMTVQDAFRKADQALYLAKRSGRNRVAAYTAETIEAATGMV